MCSVILRARRAKKAADGYTIATAGCNFRNGTDDRAIDLTTPSANFPPTLLQDGNTYSYVLSADN